MKGALWEEAGIGLTPALQVVADHSEDHKGAVPRLALGRLSVSNGYCYFLLLLFLCETAYYQLQLILALLLQLLQNAFLSTPSPSLSFLRGTMSFSASSKFLLLFIPPRNNFHAIFRFF